jgi:hypothetical protein
MSRQNQLLMILIATIDLATDLGKRLATAFPECYSETPVQAPIPLSVLRHESYELYKKEYPGQARDEVLTSYDSLTPHNIPYISFDTMGRGLTGGDLERLPDGIDVKSKLGDVVEHKGGKWVV